MVENTESYDKPIPVGMPCGRCDGAIVRLAKITLQAEGVRLEIDPDSMEVTRTKTQVNRVLHLLVDDTSERHRCCEITFEYECSQGHRSLFALSQSNDFVSDNGGFDWHWYRSLYMRLFDMWLPGLPPPRPPEPPVTPRPREQADYSDMPDW